MRTLAADFERFNGDFNWDKEQQKFARIISELKEGKA